MGSRGPAILNWFRIKLFRSSLTEYTTVVCKTLDGMLKFRPHVIPSLFSQYMYSTLPNVSVFYASIFFSKIHVVLCFAGYSNKLETNHVSRSFSTDLSVHYFILSDWREVI